MGNKKKKANGEVKAAPRGGPSHNIRFRNREEKRAVSRAAKQAGLTINTWIVDALAKASKGSGTAA